MAVAQQDPALEALNFAMQGGEQDSSADPAMDALNFAMSDTGEEAKDVSRLESAGKSAVREFGGGIGDTIAGAGNLVDKLKSLNPLERVAAAVFHKFGRRTPNEFGVDVLRNVGRELRKDVTEALPPDEHSNEFWSGKLPGVMGGMVPGITAALVNPALGVAAFTSQGSESTGREAREMGATPKQQDIAEVGGAVLGSLEMLPIGRLMKRYGGDLVRRVGTGMLMRFLKSGAGQAVEEGAQEAISQVGQNVLAKDIAGYDPTRGYGEGVLEATALGSVAGGITGAPAGIIKPKKSQRLVLMEESGYDPDLAPLIDELYESGKPEDGQLAKALMDIQESRLGTRDATQERFGKSKAQVDDKDTGMRAWREGETWWVQDDPWNEPFQATRTLADYLEAMHPTVNDPEWTAPKESVLAGMRELMAAEAQAAEDARDGDVATEIQSAMSAEQAEAQAAMEAEAGQGKPEAVTPPQPDPNVIEIPGLRDQSDGFALGPSTPQQPDLSGAVSLEPERQIRPSFTPEGAVRIPGVSPETIPPQRSLPSAARLKPTQGKPLGAADAQNAVDGQETALPGQKPPLSAEEAKIAFAESEEAPDPALAVKEPDVAAEDLFGPTEPHERGVEREFAFDPTSTEKAGKFRLQPKDRFEKFFTSKSPTKGVTYLMGRDKDSGQTVIHEVRFDKKRFDEAAAKEWFDKNKERFGFAEAAQAMNEPQPPASDGSPLPTDAAQSPEAVSFPAAPAQDSEQPPAKGDAPIEPSPVQPEQSLTSKAAPVEAGAAEGDGFVKDESGFLALEPIIEAATAAKKWTNESVQSAAEWLTRKTGDTIKSVKDAMSALVERFGDAIRSYVPRIYKAFKEFVADERGQMMLPSRSEKSTKQPDAARAGMDERFAQMAERVRQKKATQTQAMLRQSAADVSRILDSPADTPPMPTEFIAQQTSRLDKLISKLPVKLQNAIRTAFREEFTQSPFIRGTFDLYKAEHMKDGEARAALTRMTLGATHTPEEMVAADRILRGDPVDIDNLSDAFYAQMGTTKEAVREVAQRMTADRLNLGLPINEAWKDGDSHWYPSVREKYRMRRMGGKLYADPSAVAAPKLKLTGSEKGGLKARYLRRFWVMNKKTKKPVPGAIFDTEADATSFLEKLGGDKPYFVKYWAKDETGKRRLVTETFATAKEQREFVNAANENGSIKIDESFRLTEMGRKRGDYELVHPLTPDQDRAAGLVEDVIHNINEGFRSRQGLIRKIQFFDRLAKHFANGEDSEMFMAGDAFRAAPRPGFVRISDLNLGINPETFKAHKWQTNEESRNPALAEFLDGAISIDLANDLVGAFGGTRQGVLGLLQTGSDFMKSLDRWLGLRKWVTYRYPFRYIKQIPEGNASLYIADAKAFFNWPRRAVATKDFWSWVATKKTDNPNMQEFLKTGLLETDFLHGSELSDFAREMADAEHAEKGDLYFKALDGFYNAIAKRTGVKEGRLEQIDGLMKSLYQLQDAHYKYVLFDAYLGRGMDPAEAASKVDRYMFNWARAPRIVKLFQFIPFTPSVLWQYGRIFGNKMADEGPAKFGFKMAITLAAMAALREQLDELAGVDDMDRETAQGDIPTYRWSDFAIPGWTDSQGRQMKVDIRGFVPFADVGRLWPEDWKSVRGSMRSLAPMSLQAPITLATQTDRFGNRLTYDNTKDPDKQAEQRNRVFAEASADLLPGMLGQYWYALYKNANRKESTKKDLINQALTQPAAAIGPAINYPKR